MITYHPGLSSESCSSRIRILLAVATSVVYSACSGGDGTTEPNTVASVSVSPASQSIQVGNSVQLTATPKDANGAAVSGQSVSWSSMTNITWLANANLAASNRFGLPVCTDPLTPALCVAADGAMTFASTTQFLANMNAAAYLGQTNWQLSTIDANCPGYNCVGAENPMGNLFYTQLGFIRGGTVATPHVSVGPFRNIQPYLYWSCAAPTIQSACDADGAAPNFQWSFSFGSGFQGTDLLANSLFVTVYFVGRID